MEDLYTTVLYNDEVHTFDEVITTLQRAVDNCDRNQAIRYTWGYFFLCMLGFCDSLMYCSFVSLIDREGRSLVKCSSYQACNEVSWVEEKEYERRLLKPVNIIYLLFWGFISNFVSFIFLQRLMAALQMSFSSKVLDRCEEWLRGSLAGGEANR